MRFDLNKTYPAHYAGRMDALHVPSLLVVCDSPIIVGSFVKFTNKEYNKVTPASYDNYHAIVDPFLTLKDGIIPPNTGFVVMMRPGTVEGLHHHFEINI